MKKWLKNVGPGLLVSAAFIGPGTVTVCSLAGVNFRFSLLWALLLSIVSCMVLQEMAARLGLVTQKGLSEVIRIQIRNPILRIFSLVLIFSAIVIGNAAYEAGNITGAVLGISAFAPPAVLDIGPYGLNLYTVLTGLIAFLLLWLGNYKLLEKILIGLVGLMSLSFIITAIVTRPEILMLLKGLFIPRTSDAGLFTVMAIIGTTVVPYNLFLHASLVTEKWNGKEHLGTARKELFWAILLGGLVSMAVMITAAASGVGQINSAADLAVGLQPLFGPFARWMIGIGLFAAGISSAITAPLAAAYVLSGCFGWKKGLTSLKFKITSTGILLAGVVFSSLGFQPVELIKFAQVANGILLPVIAIFLFSMVNSQFVMGEDRNNIKQNLLAVIIIGISIFLGAKSILSVFQAL